MRQVFISYCRRTMIAHAEALHQALGGSDGVSFLDTTDIGHGEHIPRTISEAILASRVAVVFADRAYFTRWYCLKELDALVAPFLHRVEGEDFARSLIIALPVDPEDTWYSNHLPPSVRTVNWPRADQTSQLAALVRARLQVDRPTSAERLAAAPAMMTSSSAWDNTALPPPRPVVVDCARLDGLLPSIGEALVGRANDLWRVHFHLSTRQGWASAGTAAAVAIEAGSGIGKTRVAAEYVHRFWHDYPGGVFWIDGHRLDAVETQLFAVLRTFGLDVDHASFSRAGRSVRSELAAALEANGARRRILFVIDDLPEPSPEQPPPPLEALCPSPASVALLITSRARWSSTHPMLTPVSLDILDEDAAIALLTRHVPHPLSDADERDIVRWVGHLPLALELLNAALRAGAISGAALAEKARATRPTAELDAQVEALRGQVPDTALRGISETFSLSYDHVSLDAQQLARTLAQFAATPIPVALLEALPADLVAPHHRAELILHSLVTPRTSTARGVPMFGSLHTLFADFLRAQCTVSGLELDAALGAMRRILPSRWTTDEMHALMLASAEHAEQLILRAMNARFGSLERSVGTMLPDTQGRFTTVLISADDIPEPMQPLLAALDASLWVGSRIATFLREEGSLDRALAINRLCYSYCTRIFGEDHPQSIIAADHLALNLSAVGRNHEAAALQQNALARSRRILGDDDLSTVKLLDNLGHTYLEIGEFDRARHCIEEALASFRRLHGEDHEDTLVCMTRLAAVRTAEGKAAEAKTVYEDVLRRLRRADAPNSQGLVSTLERLAAALSNLGERERAIGIYREVLDLLRRHRNPNHADIIMASANLGFVLLAAGQVDEAFTHVDNAFQLAQQVLGSDHPRTLLLANNLAEIQRQRGQPQRAAELLVPVLKRMRRTRGDRDPLTLTVRRNLGLAAIDSGDLEKAERLIREEIELLTEVRGRQHEETIAALRGLAMVLERSRDLEGALAVREDILERETQRMGTDGDTTEARLHLALIQHAMGRTDLALPRLREVVAERTARRGPLAPTTLTALAALAELLESGAELDEVLEQLAAGYAERHGPSSVPALTVIARRAALLDDDLPQATALLQRSLALARIAQPDHAITGELIDLLANVVAQTGLPDQARELREEHVEHCSRVLGPSHRTTLEALCALASLCAAGDDHQRATALYERVLTLGKEVLNPDDPIILSSMDMLGVSLTVLGELVRAETLQRQAAAGAERALGPRHHDTIACLANLAATLDRRGRYAEASALLDEALARTSGADEPTLVASVLKLKADLAVRQGDFAAAQRGYARLGAICTQLHGAGHPETLRMRNAEAAALRELGQLDEAIAIIEEARTLALAGDEAANAEPRAVLSINLASLLWQRGDVARAREIQESELALSISGLGLKHPQTVLHAWALFCLLYEGREHDDAHDVLQRYLMWLLSVPPHECLGPLADIRREIEALTEGT